MLNGLSRHSLLRGRRILLMLGLDAMLGCTPREAPSPPPTPEVLMEADRAFARATAERRAAGWVSFFADDGAQLVPGSEVRGQDAIRELMGPAFADTSFTLSWEPTRADIAASGDVGYTIGRYVSRRTGPDGILVESTGAYVTMWRRNPEGVWKVVLDSGVPDPAR